MIEALQGSATPVKETMSENLGDIDSIIAFLKYNSPGWRTPRRFIGKAGVRVMIFSPWRRPLSDPPTGGVGRGRDSLVKRERRSLATVWGPH
jgi:hypothetical protein